MSTTRIKKLNLKSQPAEVNNKSEASQRLNTENLEYAYLVGLIEADPVGLPSLKITNTLLLKWRATSKRYRIAV